MFGKSLEKRIVFLVTFSDGGELPCLESIQSSTLPFNSYFEFNNSALLSLKKMDDKFNRIFWEMGQENLANFFKYISASNPIMLK